MTPIRWLAFGSISAALIAAVVFVLSGSNVDGWPSTSVAADTDRPATTQPATVASDPGLLPVTDSSVAFAPDVEPDTGTVGATAATDAPADTGGTATTDGSTSPAATSPAATNEPASTASQVRLRIPTLAVDAAITSLGFDGAGGYAVPGTASGVGWYEFSAYPGAAGNAVLGGHLNWRGSRGVFDRLDELSAGDMIYVDTAAGEVAYQVVGSHSVTAQTPFIDILGERSGPSTLTLFTCGGTYSSAAGEYDQRLVVNAVRV